VVKRLQITPLDLLSEMLESYAIDNREGAPQGWAPRVLVHGGVPHEIVLDYFHNLKESGVSVVRY